MTKFLNAHDIYKIPSKITSSYDSIGVYGR